jgi:hypothetical protein
MPQSRTRTSAPDTAAPKQTDPIRLAFGRNLRVGREPQHAVGPRGVPEHIVAIVFVLWFPFVQACIRFAVAGLGKPVNMTGEALTRLDLPVRVVLWLCDQLGWWWIISVLLAALAALVLNSELWAALSRVLPLPRGRSA